MGLDLPLSLYLGCTKARWSWVYVLPITLKAVKVNFCVVPNMYHTTTALCVKTRVRRRNIGRWRETAGSVLRSSPVFLTQWIKLSVVLSHNSRLMSKLQNAASHISGIFSPKARLRMAVYSLSLIADSDCIWFLREKRMFRVAEEILIECAACDGLITMSVRIQRTQLAGSIPV
jgi:hypothetical protein